MFCYCSYRDFLGNMISDVARVPCALGQEIFLRPLSTKTTEFEVKIGCKSADEAEAEHLLWLFCPFLRVIKRI